MGDDSPKPQSSEEQMANQQHNLLMAFIAKMESIPDENPQDGLSNRDHDQLIYGS
jgi:hypothetical protein